MAAKRRCPDVHSIERQSEFSVYYYPDGSRSAAGRHIAGGWTADNPRGGEWLECVVPVGKWSYWDESGTLRAEISYKLSCYMQCCAAGPCPIVHSYPAGPFRTYHPSGRPRTAGSLGEGVEQFENNCDVSVSTRRTRSIDDLRLWDDEGNECWIETPTWPDAFQEGTWKGPAPLRQPDAQGKCP